jgi:hypothetical protein
MTVISWLKRFRIVPISVDVKNESGALELQYISLNTVRRILEDYSEKRLMKCSTG